MKKIILVLLLIITVAAAIAFASMKLMTTRKFWEALAQGFGLIFFFGIVGEILDSWTGKK